MNSVTAVPVLSDNYVWTYGSNSDVVVVDPGEAKPVARHLREHGLDVAAYLITHHHGDHTGGLNALLGEFPAPVYAPASESDRIPAVDHPVSGNDRLTIDALGATFDVIDAPGHTLGHVVYYTPGVLFSGDALFRAGCGRVFEGTHAQMRESLARLRELPAETAVYGGHEYTRKNLAFARIVEPDNNAIAYTIRAVEQSLDNNQPSLPAHLGEELEINPFLRWDHPDVKTAASTREGRSLERADDVFATIRNWKDSS